MSSLSEDFWKQYKEEQAKKPCTQTVYMDADGKEVPYLDSVSSKPCEQTYYTCGMCKHHHDARQQRRWVRLAEKEHVNLQRIIKEEQSENEKVGALMRRINSDAFDGLLREIIMSTEIVEGIIAATYEVSS
jgi:hypothetical protein